MNGKQILLSAIQGETTPRAAWLPFVGVHGGKLIDATATEYLQSAELIVKGLRKARELYRPDGLPIVFDLQIEAEILGCDLQWADDAPPAVCSHPLKDASIEDLPAFDTTKGRFPLIGEALDSLNKSEMGDEVALYGLITGPFTLCMHLMGNDIFMDMFMNPDRVKAVIDHCSDVAIKSADFYLDRGCEVIGIVDPMTSQISPDHFDEFVAPYVDRVFNHIRSRGGFSSLFVCGDASRNLDKMCQTTCDNLSIDENIPLEMMRDLAITHGKSFGGNMKLTTVLLLGSRDDSMLDAIRCLDTARSAGFILAPGCDLPYDTPPENLQAVAQMVHDPYQRDVARQSSIASEVSYDDIHVPDYAAIPQLTIDVITLDSATCPPCQYMVDAAQKAATIVGEERVLVREHKIRTHEGIGLMSKLGVQNIPTICIDGQVKFSSIIPDQTTLVDALEASLKSKN